MDYKIFFTVLFAGILLFGCIGGGQQETGVNYPKKESGQSEGVATDSGTTFDLTGKTWAELVALDTPIVCTVKYDMLSFMPGLKSMVMYIKGNKLKEMIVTTQEDGTLVTMDTIYKEDGYVYTIYDAKTMTVMTQGKIICDGIKHKTNESVTEKPYADIHTLFSCKLGTFGDEMFETTGKYCTMKEIMKALTSS